MLWFGHRLVVLTNCPTSSLRKSHLVFTSDIHNLKMDGHFTSHAWPTKPWISDDSAWSNPLKKTESITTEKNTVSISCCCCILPTYYIFNFPLSNFFSKYPAKKVVKDSFWSEMDTCDRYFDSSLCIFLNFWVQYILSLRWHEQKGVGLGFCNLILFCC